MFGLIQISPARQKTVLGKEYKKEKTLAVVIRDLVNHPNCEIL